MHQIAPLHEVADNFLDYDIAFSPAELHGLLTSHLCLNANISIDQWLSCAWHLLDIKNPPNYIVDVISNWYEFTKHQLHSTELIFYPYVLDDDDDVEEKILALAQWCQGYVVGIASYGQELKLTISKEIKEIILDLTKISQVDTKDNTLNIEEKENSYMEIIEYVRMAVICIRDEYHLNKDLEMQQQQPDYD
jgi:uncharacterized protein